MPPHSFLNLKEFNPCIFLKFFEKVHKIKKNIASDLKQIFSETHKFSVIDKVKIKTIHCIDLNNHAIKAVTCKKQSHKN